MTNTSTRIIVAIVTIPIILFLAYVGRTPFLIFVELIATFALWEFLNFKSKELSLLKIWGVISINLILINTFLTKVPSTSIFAAVIGIALITELFTSIGSPSENIGSFLFAIFYIGFFLSFLIKIRELYSGLPYNYSYGGYVIIALFATIWVCDSAAFFIGTRFGKHKLYPKISPNKSIEGFIAGLIFAVLTMVLAKFILLDFIDWRKIILIGASVGIIGQLGDLIESMFKRDAKIKDSSSIIPGHGGILDRFDSLIFLSPVVYLILIYY